jgi:DNA-binding MarR family transcriptional regulator
MKVKRISESVVGKWPVCALSSTRRAARLLTQLYDSYLSEYGIEAAQFALMMMVESTADKGQTAIAQALGMDKTTLSRNLKILRAKGWLESERGSDGRRRSLSLSAEGRQMLASAKPGWRRAQDSLRNAMTDRDWAEMMATTENVARSATIAFERKAKLTKA